MSDAQFDPKVNDGRRINDETLLALIARFTTGKHPNIHYALHELAERRESERSHPAKVKDMNDEGYVHDYTDLVIALWTAYMVHGFNLSNLGGGDSGAGIDRIAYDANFFLAYVEGKEASGWWWDGGWIDAVQEYAHQTAARAKYGNTGEDAGWDVTRYMEPPENLNDRND